MFSSSQFDGGAGIFSGGGFTSSQFTQTPDSSLSKTRGLQGVLPLTVKQISDAYDSADDKSNIVVDGVDATNVKLLGLVMNKMERVTDVTFSLDDGTGRIDIIRWTNDVSDANEMAVVQNGMYVTVIGSLKGFHSKKQAAAFSIRPVLDYNEIAHHFIQCVHVHLKNNGQKLQENSLSLLQPNTVSATPVLNEGTGYQTPVSNKSSAKTNTTGADTDDIYKLVLDIFQEPESLANEHGVHQDEVARKLGIPINKIKLAIDYHVDVGHIYSTIDDFHFKSAMQ